MFEIGLYTYSGFQKPSTSICQYLTLFVPIKSTRRNANSITSKYTSSELSGRIKDILTYWHWDCIIDIEIKLHFILRK